ncbi:Uncharacterised protein [Klebsiella pneumoniae]|nr:Uncharacterised protein [Klebsiella pneumoniae]
MPSALVTRLVRSLTDCALAFCATLLLVVFRLFCRLVSAPLCVVRSLPCCSTVFCRLCSAVASAFFAMLPLAVDRSFCSLVIDWPWLVSVLPCWLTVDCRPVMALLFAATPDSAFPTRFVSDVSAFPWLVSVVPCSSTFCVSDCSALASAFLPRLVSRPPIRLACALCSVVRELSSPETAALLSLNCVCRDSLALTSAEMAVTRAVFSWYSSPEVTFSRSLPS